MVWGPVSKRNLSELEVLTMDNLRSHKTIIVNAYPICLADKEIVDHLLVNGKVAQALEVSDQLVQLQMGISQNPY